MQTKSLGWLNALAIIIVMVASADSQSAMLHSHDSIRASIRDYLLSVNPNLVGSDNVEIGVIDHRLRLPHCPTTLDVFVPDGSNAVGRTTVGVRCPGPPPWKIYVPARVKVIREIVVTTTAISRGSLISRSDLSLEQRDVSGLTAGYFETAAAVVGQVARRPLAAGHILDTRAVEKPILVRRGDRVLISAGNRAFSVKMRGKALMNGASGERIRVENLSSGRVVEGLVTASGEVKISI